MTVVTASSGQEWARLATSWFVPLDVVRSDPAFSGRIDQRELGAARLARVRSSACVVSRTPALIESSSPDDLLFSLQLRGNNEIQHLDRVARLSRGRAAAYLSGAPYQLAFPSAADSIVLQLPRVDLGLSHTAMSSAVAVALDARRVPALRVYAGLVRSVFEGDPWLDDPDELARTAAELIGSVLRPLVGAPRRPRSRQALSAAMRQYVSEHLDNPELGVARLAAAHHLSERSVHAVFAIASETPADYIRTKRVAEAKKLLKREHLRVGDVAVLVGFADTGTFTRAFKHVTGVTPGAWRTDTRQPVDALERSAPAR